MSMSSTVEPYTPRSSVYCFPALEYLQGQPQEAAILGSGSLTLRGGWIW